MTPREAKSQAWGLHWGNCNQGIAMGGAKRVLRTTAAILLTRNFSEGFFSRSLKLIAFIPFWYFIGLCDGQADLE